MKNPGHVSRKRMNQRNAWSYLFQDQFQHINIVLYAVMLGPRTLKIYPKVYFYMYYIDLDAIQNQRPFSVQGLAVQCSHGPARARK
ncbi:unnamed protein product [Trichogramma brassicae]|uniref:Uncharacterized protein n=1 Tax=Trichogramma brassicae TaxID=86971 RepID=A0A6H5IJI0_9HYME|nr:unnamed protein product [Trichogramma brassicae]